MNEQLMESGGSEGGFVPFTREQFAMPFETGLRASPASAGGTGDAVPLPADLLRLELSEALREGWGNGAIQDLVRRAGASAAWASPVPIRLRELGGPEPEPHPEPGDRGGTEPQAAEVEVRRHGDAVDSVLVHCECGKVTRLDCVY